MAIFVNVVRTTSPDSTPAELMHNTVGEWPFRGTQTIEEVQEYGDVIYGVRRNVIVSEYPVTDITVTVYDRFVCTTTKIDADLTVADLPIGESLVGEKLPPELAWRRGEQWPVKFYDTARLKELFAAPAEATIQGYRLTVDDSGAHVYTPRGGTVTVHAGN